jgi:hypothetical protein
MIGWLHRAMVQRLGSLPRPKHCRSLLLSLLGALALTGCSSQLELPKLLYLAISINTDQDIDAELLSDFRERLAIPERSFRQIHPATRFQFGVYPEEWIDDAMRRRNRAGLGPDLLFVNGSLAKVLLEQGLIDPFPADAALEKLFSPDALRRMRIPGGGLAGLPIFIQPQVACYNRKRLPAPPTTLRELLQAGAQGHTIGVGVDLDYLFWTAGSLGAIDGLNRAAAGQSLDAAQRQSITTWLTWLQNASEQQRVTFHASQVALQHEFAAGRLDWISCSSMSLPRLRKGLGEALGVAPLPSGPGGLASPVNRLRVLALGRNSSRASRQRALAFSRFLVNPLMQRSLTLGLQTLLPANRFVKVPVQSSSSLEALVASEEQGVRTTTMATLFLDEDPRLAAAQTLITQLVFGEMRPHEATNALIELLQRRQP